MIVDEPGDEPAPSRGRLAGAALLAVLAAAAMLYLFVGSGRRPPEPPADLVHAAARGDARPEACLKCHARDAAVPVSSGHTGRRDCSSCH